jgi:PHD/YefM family antitoxin component YafN of YafNO toxin-antitoxin module
MNALPAAEVKRRGMAAIEEALEKGPVHILKRNRPAAVVLTEREFQELVASASASAAGRAPKLAEPAPASACDFLLSLPPGTRSTEDIRRQIEDERGSWGPA